MDDIRKTNRYSKEEKQAFIREFKTAGSEQSLAGFCRQKGIHESTFRGWLGRKERHKTASAPGIPVGSEIRNIGNAVRGTFRILMNGTEIIADREGMKCMAEAIIDAGPEKR